MMKKLLLFVPSLCAALLAAGCSLFPSDGGEMDPEAISIQTDRARYEATVGEAGVPSVKITIPITYRNASDAAVYAIGCHPPEPPLLEKHVNGTWVVAWAPIVNYCLRPPWRIGPGETRRDTVRVYGAKRGHNAAPTFDTGVPGTYRLAQTLYADPEGERPLPPVTSNTFEVTER